MTGRHIPASLYSIGQNKWKLLLTGLFLFLPLVFINFNSPHNWGDDFAQYLMHSQKLAAFQNPYEINYIYNPNYAVMSPPAYPLGFSLLLSPISIFSPDTLLPYKIYMQLLLVAFAITALFFLSKQFSWYTSAMVLLLVFYHPYIIGYKGQVLSDVPFALFFLLACYMAQNKKNILVVSLLVAFCIAIRNVGIVLIPGLMLLVFQQFMQERREKKTSIKKTMIYGLALLMPAVVYLVNHFTSNAGYAAQLSSGSVTQLFATNFENHLNTFQNFFYPDYAATSFYRYAWFLIPLLTLVGFIHHIIKKHYFITLGFLFYEIIILVFPYEYATLRFLIPVLPLFMLFTFTGIRIFFNTYINHDLAKHILLVFFLVAEVFLFAPASYEVSKQITAIDSPEGKQAQRVFEVIKEKTPADAVFIFIKPKALGYFGQRKSVANNPAHEMDEVSQLVEKHHCSYLLTYSKIENVPLNYFIAANHSLCEEVFADGEFTLYKLNR